MTAAKRKCPYCSKSSKTKYDYAGYVEHYRKVHKKPGKGQDSFKKFRKKVG